MVCGAGGKARGPDGNIWSSRAGLCLCQSPSIVEASKGAGRSDASVGVSRVPDARLDKLREGPAKDVERMRTVQRLEAEQAELVAVHGLTAALDDVRWLIEELRVQLFAQQLGTPVSVSEKRIRERLQRIRRP